MEQISTAHTWEQGFNAGGFGTVGSAFLRWGNEYQPSLQSLTTQTMLLLVLTTMWLFVIVEKQWRLFVVGLTVTDLKLVPTFRLTLRHHQGFFFK